MYCNEKKKLIGTLPSNALYCSDLDTFYLGECVIKTLKLNLFR